MWCISLLLQTPIDAIKCHNNLRLLTKWFTLVGSSMFSAPGYWCRTTIIFGRPKCNSLKIYPLFKQLFQQQKSLAKWRQSFVKNGLKKLVFKKQVVQIHIELSNKVWRYFRLPVQCLQRQHGGSTKQFQWQIYPQIDFSIGHSMLPLLTLTLKV